MRDFKEKDIISNYEIIFRVDNFKEKEEMYINDQEITNEIENASGNNFSNSLWINELVVINSEAKEKIECTNKEYYEYNYVYTNLSENLKKEASKR